MKPLFTYVALPFALLTVASLTSSEADIGAKPTATDILTQSSQALNAVAQRALPAVVSISTVRSLDSGQAYGGLPLGGLPHSGRNGGGGGSAPFDLHPGAPASSAITVGSGVIIDPRGYVLTNHHVIEDAERISVTFDEKHKMRAHLVGDDPATDLAVIELEGKPPVPLTTLPFADSDQVKVGDWAIAVGSPFGLKQTVTMGIISAKGRGRVGILDIEDFIQTDAALNPGSSGGPLLDVHGQVVGLNTAIYSQTGGFIGIGFAVPSKIAKTVAEELIAHGRVSRSWLGLAAQDLDPQLSGYFKAPVEKGALVTQVTHGSPADQAGFRPGDVVLAFDHLDVTGSDQLKSYVTKCRRDVPVSVDIIRDGQHETKEVRLQEIPRPLVGGQLAGQLPPANSPLVSAEQDFGATARDIVPELAHFLKMPVNTGAILVDVRPGTPAFDAGLAPGDVVLRADNREIRSAREFNGVVRGGHHDRLVVLYIQRGPGEQGEKLFIPLAPET